MQSRSVHDALEVVRQYNIPLTIRQIYYRLVATKKIENTTNSYKILDKKLTTARMQGIIPFSAIEDHSRRSVSGETRQLTSPETYFNNALNSFTHLENSYDIPFWHGQPENVELWIEKDALSNLFWKVCDKYRATLFPCRGYPSITTLHEAAERLRAIDKPTNILYFGDLDMRGVDIERNISDRLHQFGISPQIRRIALTRPQILAYNLPPVPAQKKDSMARKWIPKEGDVAWELDALDPQVLLNLAEGAIREHLNHEALQTRQKVLLRNRETIHNFVQNLMAPLNDTYPENED